MSFLDWGKALVSRGAKVAKTGAKVVKAVGKVIVSALRGERVSKSIQVAAEAAKIGLNQTKSEFKEVDNSASTVLRSKSRYDFTQTDSVNRLYETLKSIRNNYQDKLDRRQAQIERYAKESFEEIIKMLESGFSSTNIIVNVSDLQNQFKKALNECRKKLSNTLLDNLALNNSKFKSILELKDIEKRDLEVSRFVDDLSERIIKEFTGNLDQITNEVLTTIQASIHRELENYQSQIQTIQQELNENERLNQEQIAAKKKEYERRQEIINQFLLLLN